MFKMDQLENIAYTYEANVLLLHFVKEAKVAIDG